MKRTSRPGRLLSLSAALLVGLARCGVPAGSSAAPSGEPHHADAPPEPADPDCGQLWLRSGSVNVVQATDGTLTGCFRVGPVPADRYAIHLDTFIYVEPKDESESPPKNIGIAVSPTEGGPGTVLRISGFLPAAPSGGDRLEDNEVSMCWGDCRGGFVETEKMDWQPDGHFTTEMRVPSVPWMEVGGPHPLESGSYPVVLPCIRTRMARAGTSGCRAEAHTTFRLHAGPPTRCVQSRRCAELALTPESARPGEVVRVRGWAPLASRRYYSVPGTYELTLARPKERGGDGDGTVSRRQNGADVGPGGTPFTVRPGHSWSGIRWSDAPLIQLSGADGFASDPTNPRVLAHCVKGGVRVSRDGGSTWITVPLRGIREAARGAELGIAYPETREEDFRCLAAAVDTAHPEAVFATFTAFPPEGPPPTSLFPVATADGGRTWRQIRPPAGEQTPFGGFAVTGDKVQALFYRPAEEGNCCAPGAPVVIQTSDGARTWQEGTERCPARGPCVTWGPEATGNCAKGQPHQSLRRSADGGRSWSSPAWPSMVSTCDPASLVSPSDSELLLVQEQSAMTSGYPVLRSRDRGVTWEAITLPPLPGLSPDDPSSTDFRRLTVLRNGRLLAFASDGAVLLQPGADQWCRVAETPFGEDTASRSRFQAIGDRVWWMDGKGELHNVDQQRVRCR